VATPKGLRHLRGDLERLFVRKRPFGANPFFERHAGRVAENGEVEIVALAPVVDRQQVRMLHGVAASTRSRSELSVATRRPTGRVR